MQPSLMSQLTQSMAQGGSPLNQVTPAAPTYQPQLASQPNTPMPDKSPMTSMPIHRAFQRRNMPLPPQLQQAGGQPTSPMQSPATQGDVQIPQSEAELIVKALDSRLKLLGKHESAVRDHLFPRKEEKGQESVNS